MWLIKRNFAYTHLDFGRDLVSQTVKVTLCQVASENWNGAGNYRIVRVLRTL